MRYPRRIQKDIENQINTREIVGITGIRRAGKTTLLEMIYDKIESNNKVLFDLENIIEQRVFEELDFNNIWANLRVYGVNASEKAYIFLDEIQNVPNIIRVIKYFYDHYDVKFFITGSCSFYIKNLFSESLAGRKVIYELYPLDFEEFLIFKEVESPRYVSFTDKDTKKNQILYEKLKKLYNEYLEFGGFPQVVLESDPKQKIKQIADIFTSYIEKDVRQLADFRVITVFRDLLFLLMQRVATKLNVTRLSSELGISRETIYSYIAFLEGTYFLFLLPPFSRSVDREVSGTKKVYICDNGIITYLATISEGNRLENAVYLNLRKYGKLRYYQKRSGAEIDFLLTDKNVAFEVKNRGSFPDYCKLEKVSRSIGFNSFYVITQSFINKEGFILANFI